MKIIRSMDGFSYDMSGYIIVKFEWAQNNLTQPYLMFSTSKSIQFHIAAESFKVPKVHESLLQFQGVIKEGSSFPTENFI